MSTPAFGNRPSDAAVKDALTDLALDLRWSFNHSADRLWERIDPELWEQTHNPWVVLQTASRERLQSVTSDPNFQKLLTDLHREKQRIEQSVFKGIASSVRQPHSWPGLISQDRPQMLLRVIAHTRPPARCAPLMDE